MCDTYLSMPILENVLYLFLGDNHANCGINKIHSEYGHLQDLVFSYHKN